MLIGPLRALILQADLPSIDPGQTFLTSTVKVEGSVEDLTCASRRALRHFDRKVDDIVVLAVVLGMNRSIASAAREIKSGLSRRNRRKTPGLRAQQARFLDDDVCGRGRTFRAKCDTQRCDHDERGDQSGLLRPPPGRRGRNERPFGFRLTSLMRSTPDSKRQSRTPKRPPANCTPA